MAKMSSRQTEKVEVEREMSVYKRDDLIQKARFSLSVQEQKCILYAVSKIKADDNYLTEYTFDIKDFYRLCGIENESYTRLKQMMIALKSKCWWLQLPDGTESAVSWLEVCRTNKKTGKVTIGFHRDMMPFLLQLAEQDAFYTSYELQYVLPMSCQYSPRLYELLKSYNKNGNRQWWFYIDQIKKLLDCENYQRYPDFRRFVLEPAIEEINKYTDLRVVFEPEKEGRKVVKIWFYVDKKTKTENLDALHEIKIALDGEIDIPALIEANKNSVKSKFVKERVAAKKAEKE